MLKLFPDDFILKPAAATVHCEANWRWKKREKVMPNFNLLYVWNGEGELMLNKKSYPMQKGGSFLFRKGDTTEAVHNPLVLTYIHFDTSIQPTTMPAPYRTLEKRIIFESLLAQYVRLFLVKTYGAEEERKLILKQLMIQLLREDHELKSGKVEYIIDTSNRLKENIFEIANYIQQHPGSAHTIEKLADRANLSERYLSQKFKEITGHTLKSYIIYARIRRAEHLLHFTGMTVTEVAEVLGYNDLHFFSRQFKQYTGMNPSEVR